VDVGKGGTKRPLKIRFGVPFLLELSNNFWNLFLSFFSLRLPVDGLFRRHLSNFFFLAAAAASFWDIEWWAKHRGEKEKKKSFVFSKKELLLLPAAYYFAYYRETI
jgi:hypothetical protein